MQAADHEDGLLRSVAIQNAQSILLARQRAEAALLGALAMMRATLESTTDGILVTDDAGNVSDRNKKFVEMWRLPPAALEPRRHKRLLEAMGGQSRDPAQFFARVEDISAASPEETFDVLELVDGRAIERFSRIQVIDGRSVGRVWSFRDITVRRRAEEAAQRAAEERRHLLDSERSARAEAERTNAMKDAFLANLSHELRTPLSAIVGWSQVLRREPRLGDGELQRGLEAIERNARIQAQLIEDLLDMNRITSGKVRLDIQAIHPVAFIEAAIETVRPAAEAKGIRIDKRLDPAAGPVAGDPARLQQVLWNLLSNAIKFTSGGGRVEIRLERMGACVEIAVADTGIGIRDDFLAHVFERFRQQDTAPARVHGGLGLGLAIVKQLVELHGGTVEARSPGEGRGATFTVSLPLSVVRAESGPLPPVGTGVAPVELPASDLAGIRVLVVEDQLDARDLVRRVLVDCGAEVLVAETADEALSLVEHRRPDVLVSDIGMPDIDGFELLRRVRALGHARGGRVPAIALTAFARSEDRTRALRAGFLAHLPKPIALPELVATVAAVAGRSGEPPAG